MRIIDVHAHIFPDKVAAAAIPAMEAGSGITAAHDGTLTGLVRAMDDGGVDVAVVQPVATKPEQVNSINAWSEAIRTERIVPFGSIHPDLEHAAEEISRLADLGFKGVKLHPEYQRFAVDEERLRPVYEAIVEHDMVILFHAGYDVEIPTVGGTPDAFARVLDAYPDLTLILAHMGGFRMWAEVREHLIGRNVYLDTAYSRGHMPDDEFIGMMRAHGIDRILFGTDSPWADMRAEVEGMERLGLAEGELEAIMGDNTARLLGL